MQTNHQPWQTFAAHVFAWMFLRPNATGCTFPTPSSLVSTLLIPKESRYAMIAFVRSGHALWQATATNHPTTERRLHGLPCGTPVEKCHFVRYALINILITMFFIKGASRNTSCTKLCPFFTRFAHTELPRERTQFSLKAR